MNNDVLFIVCLVGMAVVLTLVHWIFPAISKGES